MADKDPILDALLSAEGCPYESGTIDSVVWMLGYKTGLERAKAMVAAAVEVVAPTTVRDAPVRVDWRSTKPRRGRLN